jgi:hypothetical protein
MTYRFEGPPLRDGVSEGEHIWIPVFADVPPGWMLVQDAEPVVGGVQRVRGMRTTPPHGDVEVMLPLAWTVRRVQVPDAH